MCERVVSRNTVCLKMSCVYVYTAKTKKVYNSLICIPLYPFSIDEVGVITDSNLYLRINYLGKIEWEPPRLFEVHCEVSIHFEIDPLTLSSKYILKKKALEKHC